MIELDRNMIYYLSHPCTSCGEIEENRKMEKECYEKILLKQTGMLNRKEPKRNKIKIVRPLIEIEENTEWHDAMKKCVEMLAGCDAIIMCGEWEKSRGCLDEYDKAREWGMDIYYYEGIV